MKNTHCFKKNSKPIHLVIIFIFGFIARYDVIRRFREKYKVTGSERVIQTSYNL